MTIRKVIFSYSPTSDRGQQYESEGILICNLKLNDEGHIDTLYSFDGEV